MSENGSEEEMAECIGVPASMSYFECIFFSVAEANRHFDRKI